MNKAIRAAAVEAVLWQTLRIMLACISSYVAARAIGLHESYWALITAVIVLQPALRDTFAASANRVYGTLIGAGAGLLVLLAARHGLPQFWLFWCALIPLAALTAIWPNLRLSCVTLVVVLLIPSAGAPFLRAFDRIFAILLGVVASIVIAAALPFGRRC